MSPRKRGAEPPQRRQPAPTEPADADEAPEERPYLTPGQVAALLHVSPKTVNRWADMGLIPCITTLGGHRRFHRDSVDAVVEEMFGKG